MLRNIVVTDSKGALSIDRLDNSKDDDDSIKNPLQTGNQLKKPIRRKLAGKLEQVIEGADVFIGVSGKAGILNRQMIQTMNRDAIVFALSNPDPEILPSDALQGGARIVSHG